jgi:hypothetical protein
MMVWVTGFQEKEQIPPNHHHQCDCSILTFGFPLTESFRFWAMKFRISGELQTSVMLSSRQDLIFTYHTKGD